jgi:hypothetical protein
MKSLTFCGILFLQSFRKVKFKGMPSVSSRSTYSSNDASISGQSTSTTSFEILEKMCRESQYADQMVERLAPSWEEVVAKMEKVSELNNIWPRGGGTYTSCQ